MSDQDRTQTVDQAPDLNVQSVPRNEANVHATNETVAAETEAISISSVSASSLEPDVSPEHNQTA